MGTNSGKRSSRNTTHSGKYPNAFHGAKSGLRNAVSIIARELSISREKSKKSGEKRAPASCRLSKSIVESTGEIGEH